MSNYQLRNTILDVLIRIEKDSGFSHLILDHEIKMNKMNPKDEGLLTEVVYGTIQRQLTLDYYIDSFVTQKKKLDDWVRMLLRMSIYQMTFLDKVPDHAIIHEAVEIAKKRGHKGSASFVNGVLRNVQRKGVPKTEAIQSDSKRLAIETSHPQWLVERWINAYGYETAKEICEENLNRKAITVRVQPLKIDRDEAMQILNEQGFEVSPSAFSTQGIIVEKGNVLKTKLFKEGYITIQDQSSMLVAEMLDVKPDMHVLDACSAPGGKATHIAEKMQDKGTIDAYDLHKKKVKLIDNKASELDLSIINADTADARQLQTIHSNESFDRILVDAPCSGLGVIRGKPEIKYHKQESDIQRLAIIQLDILESVAPLLKKNGLIVYSTCTVDTEENEHVVKKFLKRNENYEIDHKFFEELPGHLEGSQGITEAGIQLFPQSFGTDGFFLTRLIRIK
ncbi:16S rRNA (cytosine(967)-C(5))-methyltransferase [Virgibacillus profundi]|uniref:16S rRNA (cytosine(967)-C(5))-methyltransferase n=1 Tax=Virgibacillus profundi TaxID=2024555 RepID=A0A2A2IEH2_9BACI|nr:16S rRNA (cytosine(967)-C(5))-methyltransferase RsmB [Virgibacillus profundi]PAV29952.1 16S rRNA (cytosine(967)-C(5))-methyltransferase [Virgibacillus profundi]PXY54124.1 16S rRNA (cytosine(967)-C(5))-methyltransferase RsmB [Virgibacillus profundi]